MNILKNSVIALLAIVALSVITGCDQGSVFNGKQMHTDSTTRIESAGLDMRVYEFTPQTAQHIQCVFVAGNKKGGLVCFEKRGG